MRASSRIGVLGGTFDPPHCGHLAAARAAVETLGLDRLLLVVANEPWQKVPRRAVTPAPDRYAMVEAMVDAVAKELPSVEASHLEIDRGGPSYTADTVDELLAQASAAGDPAPEIFLVVGEDLIDQLRTWRRVDELREHVTLAVVARPHAGRPPVPEGWRSVRIRARTVDVSSSQLRRRLERGLSVEGLVPDAVVRCIRRRGLYAVSG